MILMVPMNPFTFAKKHYPGITPGGISFEGGLLFLGGGMIQPQANLPTKLVHVV